MRELKTRRFQGSTESMSQLVIQSAIFKSTNQTLSSFASSKKISTSTGSLSDLQSIINKDTSKDSASTASDRLPSLSGFADKAPGNLSDIIGNLQDDEEEDRSLFSLTSPAAKETRKDTVEQPFAAAPSFLPTNKRQSPIFSTRSAFAVVDSTKENETQEQQQSITSPEEVAKKRKSLETAESSKFFLYKSKSHLQGILKKYRV